MVGAAIAAIGLAGVAAFVYPRTQRHCAAAFTEWARDCVAGHRDPPIDAFDVDGIAAASGQDPERVRQSLTLGCVFGAEKAPAVESSSLECRGHQVVCIRLMPSGDEVGAVCEHGRIVRVSTFDGTPAPRCSQCQWP